MQLVGKRRITEESSWEHIDSAGQHGVGTCHLMAQPGLCLVRLLVS